MSDRRDSAHSTRLTRLEQIVADLAVQGHTNKAIAAEVHLAEKTVEAYLSRTYRKLGISRRTELAPAMGRLSDGA